MTTGRIILIAVIAAIGYLIYNQNYKVLGTLGFLFLSLLFLIYFKQNSLLYMPQAPGMPLSPKQNPFRYRHPREQGLQSIDLTLTTEDNIKIKGWHIQSQNCERIIVYFQQNAGNIGARIGYLKPLSHQLNSDVILVAYRGFSDSEGVPSQQGLKKDAKAIVSYALDYGRQKNRNVFILGRSLGGAVTTYISSCPQFQDKISGIILQNTFTSISGMVDQIFPILSPVKFLQTNHWRSIDLINKVKVPILFIMSMKDQLVPPKHMQQLVRTAKSSQYVDVYKIENGTHNSSWDLQPAVYFKKLLIFFDRVDNLSHESHYDGKTFENRSKDQEELL